jgi:hypothetical protein
LDVREFARFVLSGIAATIGKHGSRLADTPFPVFRNCVIGRDLYGRCNIVRALKVFAFRSRSWNRSVGEAARFLIVYATGCAVYWMVAVSIRMFLLAHRVAAGTAEPGGILMGAGTMMLTSYSGHRFFTYRTYQCAKHLDGSLSASGDGLIGNCELCAGPLSNLWKLR